MEMEVGFPYGLQGRIRFFFIGMFLVLIMFGCRDKKNLYVPEGRLLIQKYPYIECLILDNLKVTNKFNVTKGLSQISWFNDSTLLAIRTTKNNILIKRQIVLLDTNGELLIVLKSFLDTIGVEVNKNYDFENYISHLSADRNGENILYILNRKQDGIRTSKAYVFNLESKMESFLDDFFYDVNPKEFAESPWSRYNSMIVYSSCSPFVYGKHDYTTYIYSLSKRKIVKILRGYHSAIWSPKSDHIALSNGKVVYLYDVSSDSFSEIYHLKEKYLEISGMHWCSYGKNIFLEMYSKDKNIFHLAGMYRERIIDAENGTVIKAHKLMVPDPTNWSWR